jgi:hypothetical protein
VILAAAPLIATPAIALDLFTLWRQPEVPLRLETGAWADYRSLSLSAGRRSEELVRIQCLGQSADGAWIFELLTLDEPAGGGVLVPRPGEGLRLHLDPSLTQRQSSLIDLVREVVQWRDGRAEVLEPEQWREDPLVASSLAREFSPGAVIDQGETTRVVQGRELLCRQLLWTAADSTVVQLPHGRLLQSSLREVTAAVDPTIPLLGIAYAAERSRADSHFDPPSRRFPDPAPEVKVHTLELVGFGLDAQSVLGADPADSAAR